MFHHITLTMYGKGHSLLSLKYRNGKTQKFWYAAFIVTINVAAILEISRDLINLLLPHSFLICFSNHLNPLFKHSHKKQKDSLETRAAFSWLLILTWNVGGGPSDSAPNLLKTASAGCFWCSYTLPYVRYVR